MSYIRGVCVTVLIRKPFTILLLAIVNGLKWYVYIVRLILYLLSACISMSCSNIFRLKMLKLYVDVISCCRHFEFKYVIKLSSSIFYSTTEMQRSND